MGAKYNKLLNVKSGRVQFECDVTKRIEEMFKGSKRTAYESIMTDALRYLTHSFSLAYHGVQSPEVQGNFNCKHITCDVQYNKI